MNKTDLRDILKSVFVCWGLEGGIIKHQGNVFTQTVGTGVLDGPFGRNIYVLHFGRG